MNINKSHELCSHAFIDTTKLTAKRLGWILTETVVKCNTVAYQRLKQRH